MLHSGRTLLRNHHNLAYLWLVSLVRNIWIVDCLVVWSKSGLGNSNDVHHVRIGSAVEPRVLALQLHQLLLGDIGSQQRRHLVMELLVHGWYKSDVAEAIMYQLAEAFVLRLLVVGGLRVRESALSMFGMPTSGWLDSGARFLCLPWILVYFSVDLTRFP